MMLVSGEGGDNCNLAIGQGDLLVTCLQMAQMRTVALQTEVQFISHMF